jgi:uncharacterized protein YxeA
MNSEIIISAFVVSNKLPNGNNTFLKTKMQYALKTNKQTNQASMGRGRDEQI